MQPVVIDVGLFDGADTEYYLATGHHVIAVEANPALVCIANERFKEAIAAGQLTIIHAAIAESREPVTLTLSASNLGGSSTLHGTVVDAAGTCTVSGITMADILAQTPRAKLVKIDIEGADGLCIAALTRENRPDYLSVEVHDGPDAVLPHLTSVGFTRFKLIDQTCFREWSRRNHPLDRLGRGIARRLGLTDFGAVKRVGRWFIAGTSSGPAPWESDGQWRTAEDVSRQFRSARIPQHVWLDLHAMSSSDADR